MKKTVAILLLLSWSFQKVAAASAPLYARTTAVYAAILPAPSHPQKSKRVSLLLQRKLQRLLRKPASHTKANVISTLAIIFTGLALITSAFGSLPLFIIFSVAGFVTGIIGLSKKEKSKSDKTKSLVAVIISSLFLLFGLAALFFSLLFKNFE